MEFRLKDAARVTSYSTSKVWEHNGLSIYLGGGQCEGRIEVVTVHLDAPRLFIVGGQCFHDLILDIRKKKLAVDTAYAAFLEATMTTLLLDIGWVAFIAAISARTVDDREQWKREGEHAARQQLRNWLEGRSL